MKFFKTISLKEAIDKIETRIEEKLEIEEILLEKALNRVIAEDIISAIDLPSFNRSTVDGYAVKAKDVYGASEFSPIPLKNIGDTKMGHQGI